MDRGMSFGAKLLVSMFGSRQETVVAAEGRESQGRRNPDDGYGERPPGRENDDHENGGWRPATGG